MENKIVVRNRYGFRFVAPQDVVYIHAQKSYCIIKLTDGVEIKVSKNSKYVFELFTDADFLIRSHRSWIINKNLITGIQTNENTHKQLLLLEGGFNAPIVSSCKKILLQQYNSKNKILDNKYTNKNQLANSIISPLNTVKLL